jgi:Na+-driven multidrug efflux pump
MAIYAMAFPLRNFLYVVITGVFRSGGDTKTGLKYDLSCLWIFGVGAAVVSAFVLRLPFVWVYTLSLIFEDWPKTILCIRHFFSKKWIMPVTETGKEALLEYKKEQNKIT